MTLNNWSCGLDEKLNTWRDQRDILTRQALITYATNDLFAPTHLFFHLGLFSTPSLGTSGSITRPLDAAGLTGDVSAFVGPSVNPPIPNSPSRHSIDETMHPSASRLSFFLLADSHAKKIASIQSTPHFTVTTRSISGLQWINEQRPDLCARSHLSSSSVSSILSTTNAIMFLIETNSVRNIAASRIIEQVTNIITTVRVTYPHLIHSNSITVVTTFPCLKPSYTFPTLSSLSSNINDCNASLRSLSTRLSFTILDFDITTAHLNDDGMHLHHTHQHLVYDSILHYFRHLTPTRIITVSVIAKPSPSSSPLPTTTTAKPPQSQSRSRQALDRRNKKRHEKMKRKQQANSIERRIHSGWSLAMIKHYLEHHSVRYASIPPTHRNILHIQFNNATDRTFAEQTLTDDMFDEPHFLRWTMDHQS